MREPGRGWRTVLPDLVVWVKADAPPGAIVIEAGIDAQTANRRPWRADVMRSMPGATAGCAMTAPGPPPAQQITQLAAKVGPT